MKFLEKPYPLMFAPVYKDYPWGGARIPALFARAGAPAVCAESWEISAHKDGMGVVENGALAGAPLEALAAEAGEALLGANHPGGHFPLLVKIIDARERLSLQVHPNEESAKRFGGEAKTEMWHILDAPPGAFVCAGLKDGAGPRIFSDAAKAKRVTPLLRTLPVEPGRSVFIPGGLVHAICEGCLIFEVQQNSNTTYRVYDWDRAGADGKPRALHMHQALDAIDWRAPDFGMQIPAPMPPQNPANKRERLLRCDFFSVEKRVLCAAEKFARDGRSFFIIFAANGAVEIKYGGGESLTLPFGRSCLLPAALRDFETLPAGGGGAEILTVEA